MSLVLNVPEFWMYQDSAGFEYAKILNIPELYQNMSELQRVQNMPGEYLNMR